MEIEQEVVTVQYTSQNWTILQDFPVKDGGCVCGLGGGPDECKVGLKCL